VGHRLRVAEVVDRDDLDVGAELLLCAEEVAADPAEAVDAHPDCHAVVASVVSCAFASESSDVSYDARRMTHQSRATRWPPLWWG
jgi:hypothetical protein